MIHPTALVSKDAAVPPDAEIGPFAIVESGVSVGPGVTIMARAHICTGTSIGAGTVVHMGAVLGNIPQDLAFSGRPTCLKIGLRNVIREYVTMHRGTAEGSATVVGDDNYFMVSSHIGHNCEIGNRVIVANGALLAGHVKVGDGAFVSGNVVIHQHCRIGTIAMIGGYSGVNKDVPPYMLLRGPSIMRSINIVGMRRARMPAGAVRNVKECFRILYRSNLNITQAVEEMKKLGDAAEVKDVIDFVTSSKRGICDSVFTDEEFFG